MHYSRLADNNNAIPTTVTKVWRYKIVLIDWLIDCCGEGGANAYHRRLAGRSNCRYNDTNHEHIVPGCYDIGRQDHTRRLTPP